MIENKMNFVGSIKPFIRYIKIDLLNTWQKMVMSQRLAKTPKHRQTFARVALCQQMRRGRKFGSVEDREYHGEDVHKELIYSHGSFGKSGCCGGGAKE